MSDSIQVISPATGEFFGEVDAHDEASTRAAFEAARSAKRLSTAELKKIMLRLHDIVLERQSELLDVIQAETGKNRASAFDEVLDVAITARHYAYAAAGLLKTERARGALPILTKTTVQRAPVGVVGIIAPWNYPLSLAISDAIPALMAGNAVVLKPDSKTPHTAMRVAEMLYDAGLPPLLLQVLPGAGSVVGKAIAEECDYLMFTGSTATGSKLGAIAGARLIGFSAELGGKNPLIVTPGADISKAVDGAIQACFTNSGQLCISIERIYVHRDDYEEFLPAFVEATTALKVSGGAGWDVDMGSLISEEHCDKVAGMVAQAVADGAVVRTGAKKLPELGAAFYAPTILTDVPKHSAIYKEEVFGPVVWVETYDTEAEVIAKANDTEYGLNASVFGDSRTAQRIASQLEAGTVNINEGFAAAWGSIDAPMGGWKQSGVGRRHAADGLLKFTESRTVAEQRFLPISGPNSVNRESFSKGLVLMLRVGKRILR